MASVESATKRFPDECSYPATAPSGCDATVALGSDDVAESASETAAEPNGPASSGNRLRPNAVCLDAPFGFDELMAYVFRSGELRRRRIAPDFTYCADAMYAVNRIVDLQLHDAAQACDEEHSDGHGSAKVTYVVEWIGFSDPADYTSEGATGIVDPTAARDCAWCVRIGLIAERVRKIEWEIRNTKPSDHDSELALRKDLVGGLLDSLNVDSLIEPVLTQPVVSDDERGSDNYVVVDFTFLAHPGIPSLAISRPLIEMLKSIHVLCDVYTRPLAQLLLKRHNYPRFIPRRDTAPPPRKISKRESEVESTSVTTKAGRHEPRRDLDPRTKRRCKLWRMMSDVMQKKLESAWASLRTHDGRIDHGYRLKDVVDPIVSSVRAHGVDGKPTVLSLRLTDLIPLAPKQPDNETAYWLSTQLTTLFFHMLANRARDASAWSDWEGYPKVATLPGFVFDHATSVQKGRVNRKSKYSDPRMFSFEMLREVFVCDIFIMVVCADSHSNLLTAEFNQASGTLQVQLYDPMKNTERRTQKYQDPYLAFFVKCIKEQFKEHYGTELSDTKITAKDFAAQEDNINCAPMVAVLADCITKRGDTRKIRTDTQSMAHYRHAWGSVMLRGGFSDRYRFLHPDRLFDLE